MMKFDHLSIPVTNLERSRSWYVETLGLKIEFEVPERRAVALQDSEGFAIFLREVPSRVDPQGCALWFQVSDVDATHAQWQARGVAFLHAPKKTFWGYGAELRLWDEQSMKAK